MSDPDGQAVKQAILEIGAYVKRADRTMTRIENSLTMIESGINRIETLLLQYEAMGNVNDRADLLPQIGPGSHRNLDERSGDDRRKHKRHS